MLWLESPFSRSGSLSSIFRCLLVCFILRMKRGDRLLSWGDRRRVFVRFSNCGSMAHPSAPVLVGCGVEDACWFLLRSWWHFQYLHCALRWRCRFCSLGSSLRLRACWYALFKDIILPMKHIAALDFIMVLVCPLHSLLVALRWTAILLYHG